MVEIAGNGLCSENGDNVTCMNKESNVACTESCTAGMMCSQNFRWNYIHTYTYILWYHTFDSILHFQTSSSSPMKILMFELMLFY